MSEVYKIQVNDSEPIEVSQQVYEVSFCFNEMLKEKDKEIKRLKRRLEEYQEYVEINHKEIERLNNTINELNNAYCKVITECEEMIDNRFCMNDIAIKKYANEIKDICKYYVGEAKRLKGDGSNE